MQIVHVGVHNRPGPLFGPRSHCSPFSTSTCPSPQKWANVQFGVQPPAFP
jgi:hypothetical protein